MATEKPQKNSSDRVVLLLSLFALAVVSAVAFGRVFQGRETSLRLAVAAGTAVLLAAALERTPIMLSTLASVAGLLIAIGLVVFPHTTRYGLPMAPTFRAMADSFRAVSRAAATEVAPAAPLPPLFLAALTAVWTAAFASHTLAARARSPFLAVLPPGALLAFTNLIVGDGARPLYVLAFLSVALAVLFGDALRRVRQWGPVVTWHGRRWMQLGTSRTLRGARRVALASLGIALFAPWILPGFKSPGLVEVHSDTATHVSIDPLVDIRPQLLRNPAATVFTVRSDRPAYWREVALDRFTGVRWLSSSGSTAAPVARGELQLQPTAPTDPSMTQVIHQHIVFDKLSSAWLPAAFDPVAIRTTNPVQFDPRTHLLVAPYGTSTGFAYDVTSVARSPTPEQLEVVGSFSRAPSQPALTSLPRNTPREIYSIAHHLADASSTSYDKILAIQDYLRGFRYDEKVRPGDGTNAVLYFLTKSRAGFCQQFAGTMAVLLRALGIPARVAVGFTPGTLDPKTGTYVVTTKEAHAWVEVLFPRYGWLSFEPTPGRTNPVALHYTSPPVGVLEVQGPQCLLGRGPDGCVQTPRKGGRSRASATPAPHQSPLGPPGRRTRATGRLVRKTGWKMPALLGLLGSIVLVLLSIPLVKTTARRLALARAHDPRDRALAAYRRMAWQAADVGLARRAAETLPEYRVRLKERVGFLDGDLDRLTTVAMRAAYSASGVSRHDAEEAVRAATRVARDLRRAGGLGRRLIGLFRPVLARRSS